LSSITLDFDAFERAIIRALRRHPEGIRNTKLHQESRTEDGKRINVKTYNKHLKALVRELVVERVEEGRAKVVYKLRPTEDQELRQEIRDNAIGQLLEDLVALFEHRKETTMQQAGERFNEILLSNIFKPLKGVFVYTVSKADDPIEFSLSLNDQMEFYRESLRETYRIIEQNDETRTFFHPLLKENWSF